MRKTHNISDLKLKRVQFVAQNTKLMLKYEEEGFFYWLLIKKKPNLCLLLTMVRCKVCVGYDNTLHTIDNGLTDCAWNPTSLRNNCNDQKAGGVWVRFVSLH